jgi:hypothetical protein
MTVWQSIALHTTPEIPRYKQPEAVPATHPRTGVKQRIVEAFSAGMRDKRETTFRTMNTDILEATVPGYVRPNFCDYIQNSRFES